MNSYPANEQQRSPGELNALFEEESPPTFLPTYNVYFPEYSGTAIQTEHIIRDLSPITTDIYGYLHGRKARLWNPCYVWMSEIGFDPSQLSISDSHTALALKAKTTARTFCFYLHKGCKKVTLHATSGGDTGLGIVQDNFLTYCNGNTVYPASDNVYVSPALTVTQRIVNQMRQGAGTGWTARQLSVVSVTDTHNHYQFQGDGTAKHPNLYDREVLAILPFQSNQNRFVIPYYVMTRNLLPALSPEAFDITLRGINTATVRIQCYDPIEDAYHPEHQNS